jgi:hypothetical protein
MVAKQSRLAPKKKQLNPVNELCSLASSMIRILSLASQLQNAQG